MNRKLLFLIGSLNGGGAERLLRDILVNFDYRNFDVDLLLIENTGIYIKDIPDSVNIFSVFKDRSVLWARLLNFIFIRFKITFFYTYIINRRVKKKYDTIVSFLEGETLLFHSFIFHKAIKNVSWVHSDLNVQTSNIQTITEIKSTALLYETLSSIIFVSNDVKSAFFKKYHIECANQVIYNMIDRDLILRQSQDLTVSKNKFTVIIVGRLSWEKNVELAIRAIYKLLVNEFDLELWILGLGPELSRLQCLVKNLGIEKSVILFGFMNPPYPWIAASDVVLNTSHYEGLPLSICEALCLSKPIVATFCAGSVELLEDNEYGMLCERNIDSVYDCLSNLFLHVELRKHYSDMAHKKSMEIFDKKNTMEDIIKVLS